MKLVKITCLLFLLVASAQAQADLLSKRVTLHYEKARLSDVLDGIAQQYQIRFSYSSDFVNVRQRVSVHVQEAPLSTALDQMFAQTQIVYAPIGGHIVLRSDPNKPPALSKTEKKDDRKKNPSTEPTEAVPAVLVSLEPPQEEAPAAKADSIIALALPDAKPMRSEGKMYPFDETLLNLEKWRYKAEWTTQRGNKEKRIAQVSVLPLIGTNTLSSDYITNNISMNLLWGINGGVDGLEIGGGINTVQLDVKGFQAAGIGNKVGRNVTGTQVGGVFNYTGGTTRGLQAAGVFNFAQTAEAAQTAGLANIVREDVSGMQASGLFNRAGGNAYAFQAASLFNTSGGHAKVQAAGAFNISGGTAKIQFGGLFNVANDVDVAQVGGVFNVAKGEMKGLQIGFINISDTVSGVPIGLINIVKRGYNKFEIYGSEILHGNLQLKLGANAFYNIFHVGARVPPGDGSYIWGLGYGIGTVTTVSKKATMNWELMAIHVSENEAWTNKLNSIGQFRLLWNHQIGKSIGFFFGPTANVMLSQLRNPETGEIRSPVVPYTLIDKDLTTDINLKTWVGVNAGFRF